MSNVYLKTFHDCGEGTKGYGQSSLCGIFLKSKPNVGIKSLDVSETLRLTRQSSGVQCRPGGITGARAGNRRELLHVNQE